MFTAPPVCFLASSANAMAFLVWKLLSGHTVDRSQFVVGARARVEIRLGRAVSLLLR
jgi:hypothetical protein